MKPTLEMFDQLGEALRATAKAAAVEVAIDLMKNAKSENVHARMAEFLLTEGKGRLHRSRSSLMFARCWILTVVSAHGADIRCDCKVPGSIFSQSTDGTNLCTDLLGSVVNVRK